MLQTALLCVCRSRLALRPVVAAAPGSIAQRGLDEAASLALSFSHHRNPFRLSPPLGFSSESLPHLAEYLSPVPSYLPPNLLVRPGLSVLVTLTSQL